MPCLARWSRIHRRCRTSLASMSRRAVSALVIGIFLVGLYVGVGHDRFITCEDFARAGDYVPENCRP